MVDTQPLGQGHHDLLEAARDDPHAAATRMQRLNELGRPLGGAHLGEDLGEDLLGDPGQRRHPLAQGGREVQLPAHRPGRDLGNQLTGSGALGDELDDLLLDEGGVHVHDQQAGALAQRPAELRGVAGTVSRGVTHDSMLVGEPAGEDCAPPPGGSSDGAQRKGGEPAVSG